MLPIFSVYVAYWRSSVGLFEMHESQEAGRLWKDTFLLCCALGDVQLLPGHGRANPKCNSFQFKGSLLLLLPFPPPCLQGSFTALLRNYLIFFTAVSWLSPVVVCEIWLSKFALFSWVPFYRNGAEIFFLSLYALPLAKTSSTVLTLVRCCLRAQLHLSATGVQSLDSSRALGPFPKPNGKLSAECVYLPSVIFCLSLF